MRGSIAGKGYRDFNTQAYVNEGVLLMTISQGSGMLLIRRQIPSLTLAVFVGCLPGIAVARELQINSTPEGAQVVVDGRPLGTTPLTTSRAQIMPHWTQDGQITRATISIEHPLYEKHQLQVSEFRMPKLIEADLVRRQDIEHFENYLEELPELRRSTTPAPVAVLRMSDSIDADAAALYQQGYVMVGYLGVSAEIVPKELVLVRGQEQQAALILMASELESVQTEMREVTVRSAGSSSFGTTSIRESALASGHMHGSGAAPTSWSAMGSASQFGTHFSFTPGRASSTFVPFSRRTFKTQATFWRKRQPNELGAYLEPLPSPLRGELKRNTGAFVVSVDDDSPAFFANLLVGDVITEFEGVPVRRAQDALNAVATRQCRTCTVKVLREGSAQEIGLTLEFR